MVKFASLPLGLAAAATASAASLPSVGSSSSVLVSRDDSRRFGNGGGKADEWCPNVDYDDPESREGVWYGSAAGLVLDDWIYDVDEGSSVEGDEGQGGNWFKKMVGELTGSEDNMYCNSIGEASCRVPESCKKMYEDGHGSEYWILKQVESLNNVLSKLRDTLVVESSIENIFDAPQIAKDFKEPDDGVELKYVRGILGASIGAFSAAVSPVAGGGAGVAGGILGGIFNGMNVARDEEEEEMLELSAAMKKIFQSFRSTLDDVLENALGRGDQTKLPKAAMTKRDGIGTPTALFFDAGKWFVKSNGAEVNHFIDQARKWMKQSLAVLMLRSRGFEVLIWDDLTEDECWGLETKKQSIKTARYIGATDHPGCYILHDKEGMGTVLQNAYGPMRASDSQPGTLDDDQYEKLIGDTYKVSLPELYRNALRCAEIEKEDYTAGEMFDEGSDKTPHCLFNLPVKKVEWENKFHGTSGFKTLQEDFKKD